MSEYVRRRAGGTNGVAAPQLDPGSVLAKQYPALWEFLTLSTWEGGDPRQPGSITVFLGSSGLQACVSDKDGGLVAFVTGRSLEAILLAVDAGIADDSLDWRRPREQGGGRPRGRG